MDDESPGGGPGPEGYISPLVPVARMLFPVMLLYSIYLLVGGHYGPGGGFSGGLVAGLAFVLRHIASGEPAGRGVTQVHPPVIMGWSVPDFFDAGLGWQAGYFPES
ncbi:MnhB domain-containing protein [Pseudonocardia sp. Ae505_Ps2]|uniref:MnhB domain-containing protein n=1 Tax=Pseudonocardia sp. Ae505_Ps2 TaxID=1885034 RepID=UPI002015E8CB|nr:MnhB domain-containing protein [Pseudonocardia sp. Ae505_Ps2]